MTNEWQPIETAPKDGTKVLLFGKRNRVKANKYIHLGLWSVHWKQWHSDPGAYSVHPTHWMPLPAPPEGEA